MRQCGETERVIDAAADRGSHLSIFASVAYVGPVTEDLSKLAAASGNPIIANHRLACIGGTLLDP
jgi:hypothetical protein